LWSWWFISINKDSPNKWILFQFRLFFVNIQNGGIKLFQLFDLLSLSWSSRKKISQLYKCPWRPGFICRLIIKRMSMNNCFSDYTYLVHVLVSSIFVCYRNIPYFPFLSLSLVISSSSFISLFLPHHVTTSYRYHSLSVLCVCVFFFIVACLVVLTFDFSRRVFVAHTSSFHFRSVVYPLYARAHVKEINSYY